MTHEFSLFSNDFKPDLQYATPLKIRIFNDYCCIDEWENARNLKLWTNASSVRTSRTEEQTNNL